MKKFYETRIEGLGTLVSGEYERIKAEGAVKIKGDISFKELKVDGTCKGEGDLHGELLDVDGTLKVEGNVKVNILDIDGLMKTGANKVYADEIHVNGILKNEEEVSADIIRVDGLIRTPSLLGDDIELNYQSMEGAGFLLKTLGLKKFVQSADHIECTKLKASHIVCQHVCAQTVYLSDHCEIATLECDGEIHMDASCHIGKIIGDYQLFMS